MNWFRISKYNPIYRNLKGEYEIDEWTSFSDVGKSINGSIITISNYINVEKQYINFILCFFRQLNAKKISISELEIYDESLSYYKNINNIDIEELLSFTRNILRENIWCKISYENKVEIHFGYDYYMYVGLLDNISKYKIECVLKNNLLFVEEIICSPYQN